MYIEEGHDDELCGGISVGTPQFSSVRDPNYGILSGIQITVFCWGFILRYSVSWDSNSGIGWGSKLWYSVRDSNYDFLLGIQIIVFC